MINKILLFGFKGMLGNYIYKYFLNKNFNIIPIEFIVNKKTINDVENILLINDINSDTCIINCIGLIPQKKTNKNDAEYFLINSIFPHILWNIVNKYNAKMIHPTTDCVFSGKKGNYIETDESDEEGFYGKSKSYGEPLCTVIRTSIIGEELYSKKSLLEWLINTYKNTTDIINGFDYHIWNGITCLEYCKVIEKIINQNLFWSGIKHIYSPTSKTKYELIEIILKTYFENVNYSRIIKINNDNKVDKTLSSIYNISNELNIQELEQQINELKIYNIK
jgi:dTDP-4-dehydrorhamnose reductase